MDYSHPQKLVWTSILLILVIAALCGLAWFFFYKNQVPTEVPQTQTQNNETLDWETYTNTQLGFEITYPQEAEMSENGRILLYKDGFISICRIGEGACGNIPGIEPDDGRGITQDIIIDSEIYKAIGYILNDGTKALFFDTPNNLQISLTINTKTSTENELLKILSTFKFTEQSDFTFKKSTYVDVRAELAAKGWEPIMPTTYERESGTVPSSLTAIDAEFPEIGYCGSGKDMICTVDFKKGSIIGYHLNLQKKNINGTWQWVVVGTE